MTDDKRKSADDVATLSGAYALNALSAEEREAFEAHLGESESLRHEVTELADTAVLLGRAIAPIEPPAALKANIMSLIASTPQLPVAPKLVAVESDDTVSDTRLAPVSVPTEAPVLTPAGQKAQSRWFTKPVMALVAAAAAIGIIVGGGVLVNTVGDNTAQNQAADQLAAINAASDMQQAVSDVAGGGTATLVWSNELQSSAVIVDGLATLPDGKVYELWYIGGDSVARPAGTFGVDSSGETWRVLDGEMQAGDTVGVTVEPAGGSKAPTTTPIVAIASA
jgi:anti-sigma-K factor RskA